MTPSPSNGSRAEVLERFAGAIEKVVTSDDRPADLLAFVDRCLAVYSEASGEPPRESRYLLRDHLEEATYRTDGKLQPTNRTLEEMRRRIRELETRESYLLGSYRSERNRLHRENARWARVARACVIFTTASFLIAGSLAIAFLPIWAAFVLVFIGGAAGMLAINRHEKKLRGSLYLRDLD